MKVEVLVNTKNEGLITCKIQDCPDVTKEDLPKVFEAIGEILSDDSNILKLDVENGALLVPVREVLSVFFQELC